MAKNYLKMIKAANAKEKREDAAKAKAREAAKPKGFKPMMDREIKYGLYAIDHATIWAIKNGVYAPYLLFMAPSTIVGKGLRMAMPEFDKTLDDTNRFEYSYQKSEFLIKKGISLVDGMFGYLFNILVWGVILTMIFPIQWATICNALANAESAGRNNVV